ncbi:hypothetical protein Anapl_09702 [Anas platyrhynchos]|uniref:Uncharacterized protein n=1 Tax=Anas platyrhynchos TaxID=8839 RepID=R0LI06_ANAPL|nr:hypothetical protein Anapl_09702 [Anas platyrhynchos]
MLSVPLVDAITVSDFIFLGPEGKSWCIHKEVEGCASVTFHIRWRRVLQLGFQLLEAPLLMHTGLCCRDQAKQSKPELSLVSRDKVFYLCVSEPGDPTCLASQHLASGHSPPRFKDSIAAILPSLQKSNVALRKPSQLLEGTRESKDCHLFCFSNFSVIMLHHASAFNTRQSWYQNKCSLKELKGFYSFRGVALTLRGPQKYGDFNFSNENQLEAHKKTVSQPYVLPESFLCSKQSRGLLSDGKNSVFLKQLCGNQWGCSKKCNEPASGQITPASDVRATFVDACDCDGLRRLAVNASFS